MRAVTFQAPGEVRVDEKPDPEIGSPDEAIIRVEASGVCGSDLHIYHGRVAIEPGFTIGHEYVGTVVEAGDDVTGVAVGDRVLGTYGTACGNCFFCDRGDFHKCDNGRVFGHGELLGSLQGSQADLLLVPRANMTLRRIPDGMSDEVALFAGDVMGTGYHAIVETGVQPGDSVAVLGLGPVGLCAVQAAKAAGADQVIAVDTVADRLELARTFGATPVHLTEEDPRGTVKSLTEKRGVDATIDAVGDPRALDMACKMTRKTGTVSAIGVYAEPIELHMGVVWLKALTLKTGHANVIKHLDPVLEKLKLRRARPRPARDPHDAARQRIRGLRALRPARGAEDRPDAVRRGPA